MSRIRIGVLMLILSEAGFFAMLIIAYAYFHAYPGHGPSASSALNVSRTGIFSLLLFSSSATFWAASRSFAKGASGRASAWLAATIALGAAFMVGQAMEYRGLYASGITVNRSLFATTFFTLTGFHGLHVCVGLVALSILLGLSWAQKIRDSSIEAFEAVGMYWHFVDGVWVAVFSVVYLWTLL